MRAHITSDLGARTSGSLLLVRHQNPPRFCRNVRHPWSETFSPPPLAGCYRGFSEYCSMPCCRLATHEVSFSCWAGREALVHPWAGTVSPPHLFSGGVLSCPNGTICLLPVLRPRHRLLRQRPEGNYQPRQPLHSGHSGFSGSSCMSHGTKKDPGRAKTGVMARKSQGRHLAQGWKSFYGIF